MSESTYISSAQPFIISTGNVIVAKDSNCADGESILHFGDVHNSIGYMTKAVADVHAAKRHIGSNPMTTGMASRMVLGKSRSTAARYFALYNGAMECMRVDKSPM